MKRIENLFQIADMKFEF